MKGAYTDVRDRNKNSDRRSEKEQDAIWWAWKDLNFRPHAYQACALAT